MFHALRQTLAFLSFDEMPDDERPPRDIWLRPKKLKAHLDEVRRRREEELKTGRKSAGKISDQPIDGPVSHNGAAAIIFGQ